jgi:hypothetical protein
MKRFVVIGLGNFGSSVAESLHSKGHEVIASIPVKLLSIGLRLSFRELPWEMAAAFKCWKKSEPKEPMRVW